MGTGAEAAATEGIGATLWGVARMGLPILTLGLVMEGDAARRKCSVSDFPQPQPDPKFVTQLDLEFLRQQKTLAELSGNTSFAQLLNVRIQQLTLTIQDDHHAHRSLIGGLNMVASVGDEGGAAQTGAAMSAKEQKLRRQLKSEDPVTQWQAWKNLYALNPDAARAITQADLGTATPIMAENGVRVYTRTPQQSKQAVEIYEKWINPRYPYKAWQLVRVDLATVHPSESLNDLVMQGYVAHLKQLVQTNPGNPQIIEKFLTSYWDLSLDCKAVNASARILQLPSGYRITSDGHHRLATLVLAAREEIIPTPNLRTGPPIDNRRPPATP